MADDNFEKLTLSNMRPPRGATQSRKRIGRGVGSGIGKTSGKGHKGHKARSGGSTNPGFEGGQMPLYRRLPKRGFTNPFKVHAQAVNVGRLTAMTGDEITPESLGAAGLVSRPSSAIKLLGVGEVDRAFTVRGVAVSGTARAKIEAAGGRIDDQ